MVSSLFIIPACASPPREATSAEISRAKEALGPFKKELMAALTGALREGGSEKAITVCQVKAPEIAAAASTDGVEIGRTSHRLRNPENAPEPWMEDLLKEYISNPEDLEPRATPLDDGRIGYVEPIRVKALCLGCHGEEIDESLRERLRDLYPEDRATGFKRGDFRGLFWVKLRRE
jgi:hypothetical protein